MALSRDENPQETLGEWDQGMSMTEYIAAGPPGFDDVDDRVRERARKR